MESILAFPTPESFDTGVDTSTATIESSTDLDDRIIPSLRNVFAACVTVIVLALTKATMFSCFTRNARCLRRQEVARVPTRVTSVGLTEEGRSTELALRRWNNQYFEWYLSDMPGDVLLYTVQAVCGFYSIHGTEMTVRPFLGDTAFASVEIFLCVACGNIAYRLVTCFLKAPGRCGFRITVIHNVIALTMYISILITREDAVLGVVAMIAQFPLMFGTLKRVIRHSTSLVDFTEEEPSLACVCVHTALVAGIAVFSITIPAIYLTVAVTSQPVKSMSYYSLGVFILVVVYFGIHSLVALKDAACGCWEDVQYPRNSQHSNESSWLLGSRPLPARIFPEDTCHKVINDKSNAQTELNQGQIVTLS